MINIIYKKDLASSEIFDNYSLWGKILKKYVGLIYNFKNKIEPESSGYVGQCGDVDRSDVSYSSRPSQFQYFPSEFKYAGEKVNKKRRELPRGFWTFEALAIVEADTEEELDRTLDSLETEFILSLDSVENGYNSNYGGKHGYKYKWKCYTTEIPKLKDLFNGFYWFKKVDLSLNPEVYVFPRDRIKNIQMEYIAFDKFKINYNDLPDITKNLILSFKDSVEIPKDKDNIYLFKCHIDCLWILYSCRFNSKDASGKLLSSVNFIVHTEYHPTLQKLYNFLDHKTIPRYIERNGWNTYNETTLFVERDGNNYIFHHFKNIIDASNYTKRDYQATVSAVKQGLGGFMSLPSMYCRQDLGDSFVREYLLNY